MSQFVALEKDVVLAMALAAGATVVEAAEQGGVCRRTVERRLADLAFRRIISDLRGQLIGHAVGRMAQHMTRAADALVGLLDVDKPAVRLRAARAVLSLGLRLHDSIDLAERVRELEEELAQKQGGVS